MKSKLIFGVLCTLQSGAIFAACPTESVAGKYLVSSSTCSTNYRELTVAPKLDNSGKTIYWHRLSGDFNWGIGVYADQKDHTSQKCGDTEGDRFIWRSHGPHSEFLFSYSNSEATYSESGCVWTLKKIN